MIAVGCNLLQEGAICCNVAAGAAHDYLSFSLYLFLADVARPSILPVSTYLRRVSNIGSPDFLPRVPVRYVAIYDDDDDYTHPVMDDGPEPTLLLDRAYWESLGIVCLLCTRRERS